MAALRLAAALVLLAAVAAAAPKKGVAPGKYKLTNNGYECISAKPSSFRQTVFEYLRRYHGASSNTKQCVVQKKVLRCPVRCQYGRQLQHDVYCTENGWAFVNGEQPECRFTPVGQEFLVVIGGVDTRAVEKFDTVTEEFSYLADYPIDVSEGRLHASYYNGYIYSFGGLHNDSGVVAPIASAFKYEVATDRWYPIASLPQAAYGGATVVLDGKIFLIGGGTVYDEFGGNGDDDSEATNSVIVYDPVTNTYSSGIAPLPEELEHTAATVAQGKIYVVAGTAAGGNAGSRNWYVYNPKKNDWTIEFSFPEFNVLDYTGGFSAVTIEDRYVVFGRFDTGLIVADVDAKEFIAEIQYSTLHIGTTHLTVANNDIYAFGMWFQGTVLSKFDTEENAPDGMVEIGESNTPHKFAALVTVV